jgi:parallel beta-helix repeat protein
MMLTEHASRWAVACSLVLSVAAVPASGTPFASGPNPQGLYVPPPPTFIQQAGETPIALKFADAPLDQVQKALDDARAADATSPILLTLTGTYVVTATPLTLPSNTAVVLYGTVKAGAGATAASLIAVVGQSRVAISGGVVDGQGAPLAGIDVEGSSHVNIDAVTVTATGHDGIVLNGLGSTVWDSGSAITRCEVTQGGGSGIVISSITQALVLDNFLRGNQGPGIQVRGAHCSIVNNVTQENDLGIVVGGTDDLVSDNDVHDNRSGGVRLETASANTAVVRNTITSNGVVGIDLDGNNNLVYSNTLHNTAAPGGVVTDPTQSPVDLIDRSAGNWVVARGTPLQAPVSRYFYPPTIDNRHADPIMNGRSRTEALVDAADGNAISRAQQVYDATRAQHPDDVIVLTLKGDFTLDGASLTLQSHSVLLLDGSISVPTSSSADQAITAANPAEFIAVSGGTIDLLGKSREGVFFPSTTLGYFDQLTVKRGGQRDVRAGKGMIHLTRGGGYSILRGNTVDSSGGRCVWTQNNNTRYVIFENLFTNCNQDGIDFDSSTSNSVAFSNMNIDNVRYGVFIEQSDSFDKVYGNVATTRDVPNPPGRAVGVYNNATAAGTRGITDKNTVFCNTSDVNSDGYRVGSISTAPAGSIGIAETAHTFMFNNVSRNNRNNGILVDTQFARSVQNYFSQMVLSGNRKDIESHPSNSAAAPDFFNPPAAANLAYHQPVTASSSAAGSSPASTVDGLAFTRWVPAGEPRSTLTIDLGSAVSVGRVVLKPFATSRALARIGVQVSQDGVAFGDVPGTAVSMDMSRPATVVFTPTSARFVRVLFRPILLLGGSTPTLGLEEVSVHAE